MDIQLEEKSLKELHDQLDNIKTGFEILKIRQEQTQTEIANREQQRALIIQSTNLLEIQQEDDLETQDWEEEAKNMEYDEIREEVVELEEDFEDDFQLISLK